MRGLDAVRGHVTSPGREARPRVGNGLGLALVALAALAPTAHAEGLADGVAAPTRDAITIAADRVTFWDESPELRWIVLEGHAAVSQASTSWRSDRGVVRIETTASGHDRLFTLRSYHEGRVTRAADAGRVAPSPARRTTLATIGEIRLESPALVPLKAPHAGSPLLARAFPDAITPQPVAPEPAVVAAPAETPKSDPAVRQAQFTDEAFPDLPTEPGIDKDPAPTTVPGATEGGSAVPLLDAPGGALAPESEMVPVPASPLDVGPAPILPENRRTITIGPRDRGSNFTVEGLTAKDGTTTNIIRGGVTVIAEAPGKGIVEFSADNVVIWTHPSDGKMSGRTVGAGMMDQDPSEPFEMYGEGNIVFRQDKKQVAGNGDQVGYRGERLYYDFRTENLLAEDAELNVFAPGLIAPMRTKADTIRQFRPPLGREGNTLLFGPTQIRADRSFSTGSRFPTPGYRFQSRTIDLTQKVDVLTDPLTGRPASNPKDPNRDEEQVWRIDARQNLYFIGPVPVFFWPRFQADSDDLDPPLRNIQFHANNYFGQQLLTDWSMFKLLGVRKPTFIDNWNLDIDYLSYRGVGVGSEIGWFGRDVLSDVTDPYHRVKNGRNVNMPYYGYFDIWGIRDAHRDTLGPGPSILSQVPDGFGKKGFQRTDTPYDLKNPFQAFRGRVESRHMQSLLSADAPEDEDFRLQLEFGYSSDRNFLEQYYKRLFDSGLDQGTLAYLTYQKENRALTALGSANLQYWYTDTQFLPKLDYYRMGDNFLGLLNYYQNSGIDYANVHTDIAVNNPNTFTLLPFDPVSGTSGAFRTGRAWTSHELDLPIDLGVLRVVPYAQGQLVGWDNQYRDALPSLTAETRLPDTAYIRGAQGSQLGRAWGAVGARANVMAFKHYPSVESELLNVHGLSHKINFDVDYRTSYSNVGLNRLGIQDQLDDNTYEYVRRYFAMVNYVGGVLPAQYDPRFLTLRRTTSPITGSTDIQDTLQTANFGLRQRLQTKRGPEGRRRIIDWMVLDLNTTYFPNANRDNFGKPFGQNTYNYEWFLGDRTSLVSYGWFEFWDITGRPILASNPQRQNNPFGLDVITTGISITRPPRGNVFIGYSIINSGPIATSALNTSYSYWLSPKWYGTFQTSYDFGNKILLGSTFAVTKIGSDFLTSVGLTVDPQRQSYQFGFELSPRLSPSTRIGSAGGAYHVDSRFAPTQ